MGCWIRALVLVQLIARASGAALTYPTVISSGSSSPAAWSATLTVEEFDVTGDLSFKTRAFCYNSVCSYPGPTIELRPGDNFTLTLTNNLPANPAGEDTTINSMHSPNNANIHTHGLHIDPLIDTIFTFATPGGNSIVYAYKIPLSHAPGTFWYHDHTHGSSALHVMGGMVGAIIVRPSGVENIPASISAANEHVIVLTAMASAQSKDANGFVTQGCGNGITCDPVSQAGDCTEANKASSTTFNPFRLYTYGELSAATGSEWDSTVTTVNKGNSKNWDGGTATYFENEALGIYTNGLFSPTITTKASSAVTLRIVHAGGGEELELSPSAECSASIIAWDGVYIRATQAKTSTDKIFLMAGARVDVQLTCTSSGRLMARSQYSNIAIINIDIEAGAATHSLTTTSELAAIVRPYYLADLTSATVDVSYANHVSQGSRPTSTCGGANLFWWGGGSDCSDVAPWGTQQPSATSTACPFGFYEGMRGSDPASYTAAHKLVTYTGDGVSDGEVNEWSLYGLGRSKHPFHLHVHHMQVVSFQCVSGSNDCTETGSDNSMDKWMAVGEWRDVFPTFEGVVKVRFRALDFPGETMLHCHFLRHEDLGMMDSVLVVAGYRNGQSNNNQDGSGATTVGSSNNPGASDTTPSPTTSPSPTSAAGTTEAAETDSGLTAGAHPRGEPRLFVQGLVSLVIALLVLFHS